MFKKFFLACGLLACGAMSANAAERIEVPAGNFGGTTYQFCYAISEVMKKEAPAYALMPVETAGVPANIVKSSEKPTTSIMAVGGLAFRDAVKGKKPFPKAMKDLKLIGFVTQNVQTLITFDPEIKTLADMKDKRFITTGVMSANGKYFWDIIKQGIPGSDKMKPAYTNWSAVQSALLDGTSDVGCLGITTNAKGFWTPVSVYAEVVASRGAPYFISVDLKSIEAAAKAEDVDYIPVLMPKGSIAENVPSEDIQCWEDRTGLGAFAAASDDLTYTIARILVENQEDIALYTPVGKSMSTSVAVPPKSFSDDMIHPGALRYYKEKGLR